LAQMGMSDQLKWQLKENVRKQAVKMQKRILGDEKLAVPLDCSTLNQIKVEVTDLLGKDMDETVKSADCVLCVFDLTNKQTLDDITQAVIPWLEESSAKVCLVGVNVE